MSDRPLRYRMILLDAAPAILRVRSQPMIFRSADETLEYARLHGVARWMVYGDLEGWWPLYTRDGPVNPPPPAKERVDSHEFDVWCSGCGRHKLRLLNLSTEPMFANQVMAPACHPTLMSVQTPVGSNQMSVPPLV